ncbi:hypothetical protein LIER_43381 [Lithospermum erythrorhizon]|uniref:Uncharacterized protein n=1 Tax=Lithospermum erythrorhizon TaxID=34254 RepID=A0AAV3PYD5_LITER
MIKTISTKHKNCPQKRTKLGNINFLAVAFKDIIRVMPNIKISALQVAVKKKFSIRISVDIARRTRDSIRRKIDGDHVGQFNTLWDYSHELNKSHPECTMLINYEQGRDANGDHRFKRIYVYLRPLVEAFKIVEHENGATQRWFLKHLSKDLGISNDEPWVFISDKQKGETSIATTRKKAAHKKGKAATKTKMKGFRRTLHKSVNLWGLGMKAAARTNNLRRSHVEKISTDNNLGNGNFLCSK